MGLYDRFYDEDSKCPKCKAMITTDWLTKQFECLMQTWKKGDIVQYRRLEEIPEEERKRGHGKRKFAPSLRKTAEYLGDKPLLLNGKVPVGTNCRKCESWLEAYAKVVDGRFTGIVEIEADVDGKEFVIIRTETTAKSLREEFANRLSLLQESCKHEKTKWMNIEWAPGHVSGRGCVCLRCEKTLETTREFEPNNPKLRNLLKRSKKLR
jgi:hypothetical protein